MPKLPRVKPRHLVRALERAGFVLRRQTGSHVVMRHPETRRMAVVPSGTATLQTGLVRAIIRQAGMSPEEFRKLLD